MAEILGWEVLVVELLATLYHDRSLNLNGRTLERMAVRAIIPRHQELFMIHSAVHGDYGFPGGGIEPGETQEQALAREVAEEAGAQVQSVDQEFGRIVEHRKPKELEYDVFRMTSFYYVCRISDTFIAPKLEDYEIGLGLTGCWVPAQEALQVNRRIIEAGGPPKTQREVTVLQRFLETLGRNGCCRDE